MHAGPFKILVTDRESIEKGFLVRTPYVLISIRDPDKPRVRIPRSPLLEGVLELTFHDAEPTASFKLPKNIQLISEVDAKMIWIFVREIPDAVKTLVVHCEQGMSRSPAVAAAIRQGMGADPSIFFKTYQPNRFVFNLILKTRDETTSG